jgi:hypothetical protein
MRNSVSLRFTILGSSWIIGAFLIPGGESSYPYGKRVDSVYGMYHRCIQFVIARGCNGCIDDIELRTLFICHTVPDNYEYDGDDLAVETNATTEEVVCIEHIKANLLENDDKPSGGLERLLMIAFIINLQEEETEEGLSVDNNLNNLDELSSFQVVKRIMRQFNWMDADNDGILSTVIPLFHKKHLIVFFFY